MAYMQQLDSDLEIVSDLELVSGGSLQQPSRLQRCSGRVGGVLGGLLGTAALAALLLRGRASHAEQAEPSAATMLADSDATWKDLLGDRAYKQFKESEEEVREHNEELTWQHTSTSFPGKKDEVATTTSATSTKAASELGKALRCYTGTGFDEKLLQTMTVSRAGGDDYVCSSYKLAGAAYYTGGKYEDACEAVQKHLLGATDVVCCRTDLCNKVYTRPASPSLSTPPSASEATSAEDFGALAEEFQAEAKQHDPNTAKHKSMQNIAHMLSQAAKKSPQPTVTTAEASLRGSGAATTTGRIEESALAPVEDLDDGNRCPEDEEEFPKQLGTCFKTCSALTGGAYPIRTSSFSCCAAQPCGLHNSQVHLSFCGGFDVAGDAEGTGCPAPEGACLVDEELFDGLCYKKCSSFEESAVFNHRVAPNMCCRTRGFKCLLPKYFKFSASYAVAGGQGDGNAATPALPHGPIQELTEMDA